MDMLQLMKERHSVRQYKDKPIEQEKRAEIDRLISEINSESGLSMQAARELEKEGYRALSVVGGIRAYRGKYLEGNKS